MNSRQHSEATEAGPRSTEVNITDAGQVWHSILDVKDVEAQKLAGHEVRKRLLARLRRERIALAVKEKVFLLPEKNPPPA